MTETHKQQLQDVLILHWGHNMLKKQDAQEMVRRALALWGTEIIPAETVEHIEALGALESLEKYHIPAYKQIIANKIHQR